MTPELDIAYVRSQFPSLAKDYIFAENAGGSQTLGACIEKITDYLINTNGQLGATYGISAEATRRVDEGKRATMELFGVDVEETKGQDCVVLGSSSTMLLENLARTLESDFKPGDEIIISGEHETNATPWKGLASRRGAALRLWKHEHLPTSPDNPYAVYLQVSSLLPLITPNTRLLALSACSNVLGSVTDVEDVVKKVRERAKEVGAKKLEICVDCVAYAPHRQMEVSKWGVEYCVCSLYKIYGPHISALFVHPTPLDKSLSSLTHHFYPVADDPIHKIQPGGPGYELVYSTAAIPEYLKSLSPSKTLNESFELIKAHEQKLVKRLLGWLEAPERWERGVRIVGEGLKDFETEESMGRRAPTISFVVVGQKATKSKHIVDVFDKKGNFAIRPGHFYAYTLIDDLRPKLDMDEPLVRISFVHYNTVEEVDKIIEVLDEALGAL